MDFASLIGLASSGEGASVGTPAQASAETVANAYADFQTYLQSRRPQIEAFLTNSAPMPESLLDPQAFDLLGYLYEPLNGFTSGGGKRTRPALCLLGAEAVGADPICALSTAAAIELFQSAALIHDDIADNSEMRRGVPCLHKSHGTGIAVNAGDLALVTSNALLLGDPSLDDARCLQLLCEITYMEQRTLEGQALDLGWVRDGRWNLTVDDYLFMATHKTAHYTAATPLACGAICGGGSEEQIECLRSFGLDAGLAFQIQDDLLNLVGDAERQGKDFRSDITEGKRTMVALHALNHLAGAQHDELLGILSAGTSDTGELARAVELMEAAGSLEYARSRASELVGSAKERLKGADFAVGPLQTLHSMADFFVERLG